MKYINLMTLLFGVLFTTTVCSQQTVYYPKLLQISKEDMGNARVEFANILKVTKIYYKNYPKSYPKNVSVFDDRFEMTFKKHNATFYFSDLVNYTIKIIKGEVIQQGSTIWYEFLIKLGDIEFTTYSYAESVSSSSYRWQLADYLFFFQYQVNSKRYDSLISDFKPIADEYCALKEKPVISEDQRKYIVQANGFNEQKMYEKAIEFYKKAIEVDETDYPAAYSNLALLHAQINRFDAAIFYMKKYLMLEPESPDARGAQDKIYLWEAQMVN